MILNSFSSIPITGALTVPISPDNRIRYAWGPSSIQDPSNGFFYQLWTVQAVENEVYISSPNTPEFLFFSRAEVISNVSLAFDTNANPSVVFSEHGRTYLYWFDPVPNEYVFMDLGDTVTYPYIIMDDGRPLNETTVNLLFYYIRAETIRYRLLSDRYTIEYTPTLGIEGDPVRADAIYYIGFNERLRLEFIYGLLPHFRDAPNIMKKQILLQKAPGEELSVVFNFYHLMLFGEVIEGAAVVITVHSGEDADPSTMLVGDSTFTDREVTQMVQGGLVGVVYRISMSARTDNGCVYVVEGLLAINDSPAEAPSNPD